MILFITSNGYEVRYADVLSLRMRGDKLTDSFPR